MQKEVDLATLLPNGQLFEAQLGRVIMLLSFSDNVASFENKCSCSPALPLCVSQTPVGPLSSSISRHIQEFDFYVSFFAKEEDGRIAAMQWFIFMPGDGQSGTFNSLPTVEAEGPRKAWRASSGS